jgi:mono/diheme cytochrome c family protein
MNPRRGVTVAVLLLTAAAGTAYGQTPDGAALYRARCASCHDRSDGRTPPRESLQGLTAQRILRACNIVRHTPQCGVGARKWQQVGQVLPPPVRPC